MIKVNLLPVRANQKKEKLQEQIVILAIGLVLILVGCGVAYTTIVSNIKKSKAKIVQQKATIADLTQKIGKVEEVQKMQQELQAKLDVLAKLKANKSIPTHLLDELVVSIPEKLWIESFSEVGGKIDMSGVGVSEEVVANFMQQLEASKYYMGVELLSLDLAVMEGNKLHKFKLTAKVEGLVSPVEEKAAQAKKSSPAKKK